MTAPITALPAASDPEAVFRGQKAACRVRPVIGRAERAAALKAIEDLLLDNQAAIAEAVSADFGNRSIHETQLLEIFPTVSGLNHARRKLRRWMKPQRRHVSLWFAGAANRVIPQAKGVVGIIAPWNYPLQLALGPLTGALAAGNRCMIKMAANSQRLCRLLDRLITEALPRDWVAVLPGVSASAFTALPFDHLVFTGSPVTGRQVMKTAAAHLTPVTLELGGKSPTIIAPDADLTVAAERILYIKYMNAGQTCVAPDYLFLPRRRIDDFVARAGQVVQQRYPRLDSPDYTAIIDERAYRRLIAAMEDARGKGARLVNLLPGTAPDPVSRKIPPTLALDVTDEMILMQEEIFGPILPVKPYRELDTVIAYINDRPRPLALYLFTGDRRIKERVIAETRSGGVGINDCAIHVAQHDLPFGGIGNSGMGQYHGYEGFLEFSKLRPVFSQAPLAATRLMAPPYGNTFARIYRLMTRWRGI